MDLLLPFFQLLYFVAHFLVSLALSVYDTFRDLHRLLLRLYSCLRPVDVSSYRLQADAALLKKVPEHLGIVIIGHHVHNITQLVMLINWCVGYGVKYISLYDAHGTLKQNRSKIVKALSNKIAGVNFNVVTHGSDFNGTVECLSLADGSANGEKSYQSPSITLNLLSLEDGNGDLVVVGRRLCGRVPRIESSMIDGHLLTHGHPDPEMVITIGEPMATLGFLPWQIRLSEFFEVISLSRFEYGDFRTILQKYSRCEQRCGK